MRHLLGHKPSCSTNTGCRSAGVFVSYGPAYGNSGISLSQDFLPSNRQTATQWNLPNGFNSHLSVSQPATASVLSNAWIFSKIFYQAFLTESLVKTRHLTNLGIRWWFSVKGHVAGMITSWKYAIAIRHSCPNRQAQERDLREQR